MMNRQINLLENYEQFKKVCFFFKLDDEYPGWTGEEKYGIITTVSESELRTEYPAIMSALSPYIILGLEYAEVRNESINDERRHTRNQGKYESDFTFDEETEYHHPELQCPDFTEEYIINDTLKEALSCLTKVQRRRVNQYFFQNMNLKAISESEGGNASLKSIWESIQAAVKKMKKYF